MTKLSKKVELKQSEFRLKKFDVIIYQEKDRKKCSKMSFTDKDEKYNQTINISIFVTNKSFLM